MFLAVAAIISVFVMLIPKPIILLIQHKRSVAHKAAHKAEEEVAIGGIEDEEEEEVLLHLCVLSILSV